MKKKKMNNFIYWGIFICLIAVITEMLMKISNNLVCFSKGLGLTLFIFGIFILNKDMTKLKTLKKRLLERF